MRASKGSLSLHLERHEFDAGEIIEGTLVLRVVKPIRSYGKRGNFADTCILGTSGSRLLSNCKDYAGGGGLETH
jgi:phage gp46-like protein